MKKTISLLALLVIIVGCNSTKDESAISKPLGFSNEQQAIIDVMNVDSFYKVRLNNIEKLNATNIEVGFVSQSSNSRELLYRKALDYKALGSDKLSSIDIYSALSVKDDNTNSTNIYLDGLDKNGHTYETNASSSTKEGPIKIDSGFIMSPPIQYNQEYEEYEIKLEKNKKYLVNGLASNNKGNPITPFGNNKDFLKQKSISKWDNFYGVYFEIK